MAAAAEDDAGILTQLLSCITQSWILSPPLRWVMARVSVCSNTYRMRGADALGLQVVGVAHGGLAQDCAVLGPGGVGQ